MAKGKKKKLRPKDVKKALLLAKPMERVIFVHTHQAQLIHVSEQGPEIRTFDCKHLFDADLIEEHPEAVKVHVTSGSVHGVPSEIPMWVNRKDVRFVDRGERIPELDRDGRDPEEETLRKMVDG